MESFRLESFRLEARKTLETAAGFIITSSQPEAINFSMGIDATKRCVGFYSSVSPIENLTASGCDETETIFMNRALVLNRPVSTFLLFSLAEISKKNCDDIEYLFT